MSQSLEHSVAFSELYMIKFSIVYEGQETKKACRTWKLPLDYYVMIQDSACPVLIQDKCDDDKKERKGQTQPVFPDNIAE